MSFNKLINRLEKEKNDVVLHLSYKKLQKALRRLEKSKRLNTK